MFGLKKGEAEFWLSSAKKIDQHKVESYSRAAKQKNYGVSCMPFLCSQELNCLYSFFAAFSVLYKFILYDYCCQKYVAAVV